MTSKSTPQQDKKNLEEWMKTNNFSLICHITKDMKLSCGLYLFGHTEYKVRVFDTKDECYTYFWNKVKGTTWGWSKINIE